MKASRTMQLTLKAALVMIGIALSSVIIHPLSSEAQSYRYIDESGNIFFVDSLNDIPSKYRYQILGKPTPVVISKKEKKRLEHAQKEEKKKVKKEKRVKKNKIPPPSKIHIPGKKGTPPQEPIVQGSEIAGAQKQPQVAPGAGELPQATGQQKSNYAAPAVGKTPETEELEPLGTVADQSTNSR